MHECCSLFNAVLGKLNVSSTTEKALCIVLPPMAHKQNTMNLSWNFNWLHYVSSLGAFELLDAFKNRATSNTLMACRHDGSS